MNEPRKEQRLEERIQDLEIMIAMLTRQLAKLINEKPRRREPIVAWMSEPEYLRRLANG